PSHGCRRSAPGGGSPTVGLGAGGSHGGAVIAGDVSAVAGGGAACHDAGPAAPRTFLRASAMPCVSLAPLAASAARSHRSAMVSLSLYGSPAAGETKSAAARWQEPRHAPALAGAPG